VSDRKKNNASQQATASEKPRLLPLPDETILRIEKEAEERFRKSATDLVIDTRWEYRRSSLVQLTNANAIKHDLHMVIGEFARDYKDLLEDAVVDLSKEIGEAWCRAGRPATATDAGLVWVRACQLVNQRKLEYEHPWGGFFMVAPSPTADSASHDERQLVAGKFQKANALAAIFRLAEERFGPDVVRREYKKHLSGWKPGSAGRAKNRFAIAMASKAATSELAGKAHGRVPKRKLRADCVARADWVAKVWSELTQIKPQMVNEGHYSQVQRAHPQFEVFRVAKKHPDVKRWIENIQSRRDLVTLAQEIVARKFGVADSTVQTDWSHKRKPRKAQPVSPGIG